MKAIYKPPMTPSYRHLHQQSIFLAGSIEMGKAVQWQTTFEDALGDYGNWLTIYNPRRDDWDENWKQSIDNPVFVEQVKWELTYLDIADIVPVYIDPNTKSPITLFEFGMVKSKAIVCCPVGYYRKGNIDVICQQYHVPQVSTLEQLIDMTKFRLGI